MPFPRTLPFLALPCLMAAQPPESAPSLLAVPIRLDLEPLFRLAEQRTPRVPPGVETWIPLPDMARGAAVYRYNLYRDPLMMRVRGNTLGVRTVANYWLEVGLKTGPRITSVGRCGLGSEGFRRVLLGVQAQIGVTPRWGLELKATPEEPMPMNTCQITVLSYDITDRVVAGMKAELLKATQTLEQQLRDSGLLRRRAEAMWALAQRPLPLAEGVSLLLNPERVRLAPWNSQGKTLVLTPELQARPRIVLGAPPVVAPRPLPDLEVNANGLQEGLRIQAQAELGFREATEQLRRQVAGRRFDTEKGSFTVVDLSVRGEKGHAVIELELKGRVTGHLTLHGKPVVDEASGTLRLEDLDYTLESRNFLTKIGEWFLRSGLRRSLQEKANLFLNHSLEDLRGLTEKGLNRSPLPGVTLRGHLERLAVGRPEVLEDRFRVNAFLEGKLQVDLDAAALDAAH